MRALGGLTALVLALTVALPVAAQEPVSVSGLLVEPTAYEGSEISVTGELVGDYSDRGAITWVQLNDDSYVDEPMGVEASSSRGANIGVGIRVPSELFEEAVSHQPGQYGRRGPKVEVTGVFHHIDPEEGGESYIAATSIVEIEPGRALAVGTSGIAPITGIMLILLGGGLFVVARRRQTIPDDVS